METTYGHRQSDFNSKVVLCLKQFYTLSFKGDKLLTASAMNAYDAPSHQRIMTKLFDNTMSAPPPPPPPPLQGDTGAFIPFIVVLFRSGIQEVSNCK